MGRKRGNGEGGIGKRANGTWYASVSIEGKRRYVYAKTRGEVAEKLRELQNSIAGGLPKVRKDLTVSDMMGEYLATKRPTWARQTYDSAEQNTRLHILPSLGKVKLSDLDARIVTRWLASKPQRRCMVLARDYLLAACEMAVRYEWITRNPVQATEPVRYEKKPPKEISREQVLAVLEATADMPWFAAVCIGIGCGLRPSEVLGLTWDRYSEEAGTLYVDRQLIYTSNVAPSLSKLKTKGSERVVQVPSFVADALKARRAAQEADRAAAGDEWEEEVGLIFTHPSGLPVSYNQYYNALNQAYRRFGVKPVPPHTFRHAFASVLVDARLPMSELTAAMGHANPAITMRVYAHILTDKPRRTGGIMDQFVGGRQGHDEQD